MPILAQDLADQLRFALDAEGADHYDDTLDIIPAINAASNWLTAVVNAALGQKKLGEEFFQDLSQARVFQTSKDSRISLSVFPEDVWTITAVIPLPTTDNTGASFTPPGSTKESALRTDKYHITGLKAAKRLNQEEWIVNRGNPFEAGYDHATVCEDLREYAYLNPINYSPDGTLTILREMEIRPTLNQQLCTVFYVKKPTPITALSQNLTFPHSVFNLLFDKALYYIAYKQGDQTTIATISQSDINTLIQVVN